MGTLWDLVEHKIKYINVLLMNLSPLTRVKRHCRRRNSVYAVTQENTQADSLDESNCCTLVSNSPTRNTVGPRHHCQRHPQWHIRHH